MPGNNPGGEQVHRLVPGAEGVRGERSGLDSLVTHTLTHTGAGSCAHPCMGAPRELSCNFREGLGTRPTWA